VESILSKVSIKVFVPKGLDEGSQAVYCLEMQKNRTVPLGNGMIGSEETLCDLHGESASRPTQTVPLRDGSFLNAFQAINCLATFI
jgi:hypothetical protein